MTDLHRLPSAGLPAHPSTASILRRHPYDRAAHAKADRLAHHTDRRAAGLASKLARSGEGCPVLVDKSFERRRRPTTNRFDQVVRAGEDPVLVVDGDLAQVLDDE